MSAVARRRIHVTDNPEITALIGRNALPGEPRAATLVRLAERGDRAGGTAPPGRMVFPGPARAITRDDVDNALYGDDEDFE
ncbi:hypothetical protein [Xylanimonas protaetiae]|uniref:Uncharacterized protein n=1 Tax=Xylanimonas protaetiae TaxID=2509457 RepID=A0A4P6F638_9MICO|nr:hypothetical protein [Xylanimonas protaetiae]QAY71202.1 hypothetical protein ET471_15140 [Xylanimonas protaetiae]